VGYALMPYIHSGEKMATFHEARSDWRICASLARTIQERARARGIKTFKDRHGGERQLDTLFDDFSMGALLRRTTTRRSPPSW